MRFLKSKTCALVLVLGLFLQIPVQTLAVALSRQSSEQGRWAKPSFTKENPPQPNDGLVGAESQFSFAETSLGVHNSQFAVFTGTPLALGSTRRTVCADTLIVRGGGAPGYYVGELHRGDTFLVTRDAGDVFVYGFAYGHVNKWGHVMKKYLC